jgi:hypothetical protein
LAKELKIKKVISDETLDFFIEGLESKYINKLNIDETTNEIIFKMFYDFKLKVKYSKKRSIDNDNVLYEELQRLEYKLKKIEKPEEQLKALNDFLENINLKD